MRLARSILTATVLAAAAGLALGGCAAAGPTLPAGSQSVYAHAPATVSISPSAKGSRAATPTQSTGTDVVQVSAAQKAIPAQLGVQVYWHTVGPQLYVTQAADRVFDYIVGLGANSVAITFPVFTDGDHPTHVYAASGQTPDPQTLGWVVAAAKARGLRVMLRPVIDESNIMTTKGAWRGTIEPQSMTAWFDSYQKFLLPYAELAQAQHVEYFVVGTELASLEWQTSSWQKLDSALGQVYSGTLEYADNWGNWQQDESYHPAQLIGVDAYPKLGVSNDAGVSTLTSAWENWLEQRASVLPNTALLEVGIVATYGAYRTPAQWAKSSDSLDVSVQTDWFTAACDAVKHEHMPGLYYWDVDSNADPAHASGYELGSFIGRGDGAIKACYTGWAAQ